MTAVDTVILLTTVLLDLLAMGFLLSSRQYERTAVTRRIVWIVAVITVVHACAFLALNWVIK